MEYRVMKTHEFEHSVFYRVACDCTDGRHDMTLVVEDDEFPDMTLHFYTRVETQLHWSYLGWFRRKWKRVTVAMKVLFLGFIDLESEFYLREEKHIDAFINAISEARIYITARRETDAKKKES